MKKLIENGIVISIANQKDDIERSILTSLVATCIHQKWGKKIKILVVDCYEQEGYLYKQRERELEIVNDNYTPPFRLLNTPDWCFPKQVELLVDVYDIVFVDLPGNLKQESITQCYNLVDVLIVPTKANIFNLHSAIDFLKMYNETIMPTREKYELKTAIYGLFSGVNTPTDNFKEQYLDEFRKSLSVEFLHNFVPESEASSQKKVSPISVSENSYYESYEDLSMEMLSKIMSLARTDVPVDFFNVFVKDELV